MLVHRFEVQQYKWHSYSHFPLIRSICLLQFLAKRIPHKSILPYIKQFLSEVVNGDRGFQQFMLDCLDHDILAVALNENVARAQVDCIDPPLLRLIEWMRGRRGNSCSVVLQMDQFIRLVYKGLGDLFISAFSRLRVCSVDIISPRYRLNRYLSCSRQQSIVH